MAINIRGARPSDYEICLQLDHLSVTDHVWQMLIHESEDGLTISFRPARLPRSMKVFYPRRGEALMQSWLVRNCFLVAEDRDGIVGYTTARVDYAQAICHVVDLVVDRPQRLRGIGTALHRAIRQWALDQGLSRLIAETQTKNYPAIRFFQKQGLEFCGYNDLYYPNQDIAVFFGQILR